MMKSFFLNLFPEEIKDSHSLWVSSSESILRLLGLGCIFLSHAMLAQLMGAKGFGNYTVIFITIHLFLACCLFGFDKSVITIYPLLAEQQQWNRISGFLKFTRKTILYSSLAIATVFFVLLINNSGKYGVTFSEALFWALLLFPFLAFIHYDSAVMHAMQMPMLFRRPANAIIVVASSVACLVYYELNNKTLKTDAAVFIYLCCAFCLFIFIKTRLKRIQYRLPLKDVTNEYERKTWLSASMPIFFSGFFALLMQGMGVLFISYFFGNTRAGIYAAAVMISSMVMAYIAIPRTLFLSRINELFKNRLLEQWQILMSKANKTAFIFFLPVCVVVVVFGKSILQLFGTAFGASYIPLLILTIGQFVNLRFGMLAAVLKSGSNKKKYLMISLIVVMLDFVLHFILVPSLGMNGAAIASVLSSLTLNLSVHVRAKKKFIGSQ